MSDVNNTGAEELEVTEPADEGAEELEVTEPAVDEGANDTGGKTSQDTAFAEMRRAKEEAEKLANERAAELEALHAERNAQKTAYERVGLNDDDDVTDAIADGLGVSTDDLKATIEREREMALRDLEIQKKEEENKLLREQVDAVKFEKHAQEDLLKLQKIDPTIKSIEDLGEDYLVYSAGGLDAEQSYWAIKAKEESTKVTPPEPIGKFKSEPAKKEYFTREEVMNMTEEEQRKYSKEILASSPKWK